MKTKSVRLLSVILAALMIMSIIPITASAAKEGIFTYTIEDGKAILTDIPYNTKGTVTVPSTLGGNWAWRIRKGAITKDITKRLYTLSKTYSRLED